MNNECHYYMPSCEFRRIATGEKFFSRLLILTIFIWGYVFFGFLWELIPFSFSGYYYMIIPIGFFAIRNGFPKGMYISFKYFDILTRLPFLAFSFLLLSPFWFWWKSFPSSKYLTCNMLLLGIVFFVLACNLVSLSGIVMEEEDFFFSRFFAKIARAGIIYINISSLVALLVLTLIGICDGNAILNYVANLGKIFKLLFLLPSVFASLSFLQARKALSEKMDNFEMIGEKE
ncbi:MAG: hypothetical protein QXH80_01625 [Candidatus Nanoarchaeia archaeon]